MHICISIYLCFFIYLMHLLPLSMLNLRLETSLSDCPWSFTKSLQQAQSHNHWIRHNALPNGPRINAPCINGNLRHFRFFFRKYSKEEVSLLIWFKGCWHDDIVARWQPMTSTHFAHVAVRGYHGNGGFG